MAVLEDQISYTPSRDAGNVLRCIARGLDGAYRSSEGEDDPEGTVTVHLSATLATVWSCILKDVAEKHFPEVNQ